MPRRRALTAAPPTAVRDPLSRARIVDAAIDLADREGLDSLSMRRLGQVLGVDPMSLYNHVNDKDDLLDGMADAVAGLIERPSPYGEWEASLRGVVLAARQTMVSHPWAAAVIASRTSPGPATMAHLESVLDILRGGGFSLETTHHALHVLGSRVLGFSQDLFDDKAQPQPASNEMAEMARAWASAYPRVAELAMEVRHEGGLGNCDDDVEFAFGLDLILDGLGRIARQEVGSHR
jgi:AcrR family transcriptional regulator